MIRAVALFLVLAAAASALACDGGGDSPQAQETQSAGFTQLRDSLRTELDNIGPNIDVVPDDVLRSLITRCHALEQYSDEDKVGPLCDAIQRAHDGRDPSLVDQIVAQLDQLEPK